ncbi:MAG: hypothetical protein KDM64_04300, partial [Verrucomicrobiae bacterium]|nr:hypothetical protein [Verrucomicrobiae bacterium]
MNANRTSRRPWWIGFGLVAVGLVTFLLLADRPDQVAAEVAKRVGAGKKAPAEADFAIGLWWAAAINLGLVVGLMMATPLWARRLSPPDEGRGVDVRRLSRAGLLAILAIMMLGGVMRWNLAHRSLWWDELWPIKFGVVGYYVGGTETPLEDRKFAEGSWQRSLWHYTRPTNHPSASFPARLSHVVWKRFAKPEGPHEFSDFAVRFPNWLASMASIGVVGLIGFAWRRPVAGILGALILAVHPWHIRYGIDLRGYSWVVLWTATGMLWLTCLLRSGRSKWWPWWAFGVNQALLAWSFLYGAAVAAAFFGVVALLVPFVWKSQEDRWAAWFRLILVNVVAAMIFIQLFAPNLLQMTRWLDDVTQHHAGHGLNADKFIDFVGWWFAGTTWELPQIPESAGLADLASRSAPALMGTAMILLGSLVGIGLYSMGRRSRPLALILGAPLVGGAVLLAFFWVTQDFFYPRFLIFMVIPMALGLG